MSKEIDSLAIAAIDGVTEAAPWKSFASALRDHFAANHANVIFRRADLEKNFFAGDFDDTILAVGVPQDRYEASEDPIPYYQLKPLKCYSITDLFAEDAARAERFLLEFLMPFGMGHLLICRVMTDNGMQAWVSVTRPPESPFEDSDRPELERVCRLFRSVLALFGQHQEVADQCEAYARVVHARSTGLIRIDQEGRVLNFDADAAEWIGPGKALQMANGKLKIASPNQRGRLDIALQNILEDRSDEELLVIENEEHRSIELLIFRVSEAFDPAWLAATRAIIYIRMAGGEVAPTPERIRLLLGLSRREAALANLLARGFTLSQAAEELGVSELTARAYLRQIFQKTGLSRQTDLIRQIQSSVASIQ